MKVEVWASAYDRYNTSECIWVGEMLSIPRKGDIIFVFDGWGGLPVHHVYWNLKEQTVELGVEDRNGEYRAKFNELDQANQKDTPHETS